MPTKKQQTIETLERKLYVSDASQLHCLHFASLALDKINKTSFKGSGVVLCIKSLSGVDIVSPVMIDNGLSSETIVALQKDINSAFDYRTELKPKRSV